MLSSKSHGFITEVDFRPARPKDKVADEDVVKALAQDYSSYALSTSLRSPTAVRDPSKEQLLNSLIDQVARKRQYLSLLTDSLAALLREKERGSSITDVSAQYASAQAKLYSVFSASILSLTEQYTHVLLRSQCSATSSHSRASSIQQQVDSFSSLLSQAKEQHTAIHADTAQREAQVRVMWDHLETVRLKREQCRLSQLDTLKGYHKDVDEEWTNAKIDKGKSMAIQRSIEKLREWLTRQRDVRKVLRLHIGLEELAKTRFDHIVTRIVTSLAATTVDEAIANYQTTIARNKSLLQEAEYKLSLQSSYDRKLTVLQGELRLVANALSKASLKEYRQKLDKSEIHYSTTVTRMKTAEHTFQREVTLRELNKLSATEAITQLDSITSLLPTLDPANASAPPLFFSFQSPTIAQAFLLLEKRLTYLLTVSVQCSTVVRTTPGSVETLMELLKTSPRMRDNRSFPELSGLTLTQTTEEVSMSSKDSTMQSTRHTFRARKRGSEQSGGSIVKTNRVVPVPQEYFAVRMQLFKDFEKVKSAQRGNRKSERMSEVMYRAKQGEKRMATMVGVVRERGAIMGRKSGGSEGRRKSSLMLARTHTNTRSEVLLKPSPF